MSARSGAWEAAQPYVRMARVDHWLKNVFILPGVAAAFALEPQTRSVAAGGGVLLALLAAGLVASSNYVLNEILDARTDSFHPTKKDRPAVAGRVRPGLGYLEWLLLAVAGLGLGGLVSGPLAASLAALWVMGLVYNVPPVRSKEVPYVDVLSEAVNNPIRLLIGWYGAGASGFPPSSFLLAYWFVGSYLMTAKRLAEFRSFPDAAAAARYRASFRVCREEQLTMAMVSYAAGFMLMVGVIVAKYHVELILACPVLMVYLAYYSGLTFREDSVAQNPERLHRDRMLMILTIVVAIVLGVLSFVEIPLLESWLGIEHRGW